MRVRFAYEAINEGKRVKGTVRGNSLFEAERTLIDRQWTVLHIEPVSKEQLFRETELIGFSQGMASLLRSGVPLTEAGLLWSEDHKNSERWTGLFLEVMEGIPLSLAARNQFPPYLIAMIAIGEATGTLARSFESSASYLTERRNFKQTLASAMVYPAVVLVVALAALVILLVYVLPIFEEMYRKFDATLPAITRGLLGLMTLVGQYGLWVVLGSVAAWWLLVHFFRNEERRQRRDAAIYRLPLLGHFIWDIHQALFCQSLGFLRDSGVDLLEALVTLAPILANRDYRNRVTRVVDLVERGIPLSEALAQENVLSNRNLKIIHLAERSGELGPALLDLGAMLRQSIDQKTKTFASLFEPILIVAVALVIGFVLVALYLPMFDIVQVME